ncbi:MAG: FG-GAP repeat protein, partial [Flavobacteriaceae bacterium]
ELALDGAVIAITAPGSFNSLVPDLSGVPYGATYIFRNSGGGWTQEAKLLAEAAQQEDGFAGGGIALHQDYLIVGAPSTEVATKYNGVAYLFERPGWQESHRVVAPDPLNEDHFGASIAATEDMLFIGANRRCNETGCWAGALYFVN